MKGIFIVIDGIDGCGKGTVITRLARELFDCNKDHHVVLTREPYRRAWLNHFLAQLDAKSRGEDALKLFVEDRAQHCEMIAGWLKTGAIVLCDRYKYSTFAYQMAQGIPFERIFQAHKNMIVPHLTLILDVPAKEALDRISKGRDERTAFEQLELLTLVRKNYQELKDRLQEQIVCINGAREKDVVYADVYAEVLTVLQASRG